MKSLLIVCLLTGFTLYACSNEVGNIDQIVEDYYETFNKRQDFEKFLSHYDEQIILEDIINGDRIIGKTELSSFFDWNNPDFESLDANSLIVESRVIEDHTAVVKGYFSRFRWGEVEFEAMHFTTILTFNESNKIIHQVDWINYPATLVDYNKRKNSNEWIK